MPISRRDQDWNAALTAAEAGLDDYMYRLNQNDQYYLYGQHPPPATGTCGAYPALAAPPDGNPAFSSWVPVPGSTTTPTFRYSVDTSCLATQGAIIVWATGKSGNSTRTVQATFRRRAFIDYLYFTDYETTDPAAYPVRPSTRTTSAWAQDELRAALVRGPAPGADSPYDDNHCVDINFSSGDVINGPLHSNDAILVCGNPTFNGNVTTSWQGAGTPGEAPPHELGLLEQQPDVRAGGGPEVRRPAHDAAEQPVDEVERGRDAGRRRAACSPARPRSR